MAPPAVPLLLCAAAGAAARPALLPHINCTAFCKYYIECLCGDPLPSQGECSSCIDAHRANWDDPKVVAIPCTWNRAQELCSEAPAPPPAPPAPTPPPPTPAPPGPAPPPGGAEYYVALDGSDDAAGTSPGAAFATLQRCLDVAPGGATCYLGGGRYDRAADQRTAVATKPVTISGARSGAQPAVLDGSVAINTTWHQAGVAASCVWESESAPLGFEVWQLWVSPPAGAAPGEVGGGSPLTDLVPLTPARFPNARMDDDSAFDSAPYSVSGRRNGSMLYSTKASTDSSVVDDGTHDPSLASSGIDFTGTIAVIPLGTMGNMVQGVRVKSHGAGSASFTYDTPAGTAGKGHTNRPYFFEGSCALLDTEGEWCVAQAQDGPRLRVWLPGCAAPAGRAFRGKVRSYLVNATRLRSDDHAAQLTLSHVTLWGGTIAAQQTDLLLDSVALLYPTWSRRALDETGPVSAATVLNFNSAGGSIRVVDSTVAWDDTTVPFDRCGPAPYFAGNVFTRNGYSGGETASVGDGGQSAGMVFEHNTVTVFNSFAGLTPGLRATVAYNIFSYQRMEADGAGVHVHIQPQNGVLIYRNWALDMTIKSFRFDRVNSATATWGTNGTVVENVAMRAGAATFKGDNHSIVNNTVFDLPGEDVVLSNVPVLFVMMYDPSKSWSKKGENEHTQLRGNGADSIFNVSGELPGIHSGNVAGEPIRPMLQNPNALDFRPRSGSKLASAGAGAYSTDEAAYWTPGHAGASERFGKGPAQAHAHYDGVRRRVARLCERRD